MSVQYFALRLSRDITKFLKLDIVDKLMNYASISFSSRPCLFYLVLQVLWNTLGAFGILIDCRLPLLLDTTEARNQQLHHTSPLSPHHSPEWQYATYCKILSYMMTSKKFTCLLLCVIPSTWTQAYLVLF